MVVRRKYVVFQTALFSFLFVILLGGKLVEAEPPAYGWTYGGKSGDYARALVQTGDDGYLIAGWTGSYGAGSEDAWLVKTDANGNVQWNKTYGAGSMDEAYALVQTADGGYVLAGLTASYGDGGADCWLLKADAGGNAQWNKTYGGKDSDYASALVQTSDGGYALAGATDSFGAGDYDFWLVKTDANGVEQWNKTYGGAYADQAYALVQTADGGYALAGQTESLGNGQPDFWLVKTDASGNLEWSKNYGGWWNDWANALVQTDDGGFALAGWTAPSYATLQDAWLVKTDAEGNMQWNETYGGANNEIANSLIRTGDGGFALAGWTAPEGGASNHDFWLVKTDANGVEQWNKTYGGASLDEAYALVQNSQGGYALTGFTVSFGAGYNDIWLVVTDASGVVSEFESGILLTALMTTTALAVVLTRKKLRVLRRC